MVDGIKAASKFLLLFDKSLSVDISEGGSQMDFASPLAFPVDRVRVVLATVKAELVKFDASKANSIIAESVLVPDSNNNGVEERHL